jgi:hypothetical protein
VRSLVVRRRNRCWDDVAPPGGGEHLTIRSPALSSTLLMVSEPRLEGVMLFIGDDWAEDHHDIEIVDDAGQVLARKRFSRRTGRGHPLARPNRGTRSLAVGAA